MAQFICLSLLEDQLSSLTYGKMIRLSVFLEYNLNSLHFLPVSLADALHVSHDITRYLVLGIEKEKITIQNKLMTKAIRMYDNNMHHLYIPL